VAKKDNPTNALFNNIANGQTYKKTNQQIRHALTKKKRTTTTTKQTQVNKKDNTYTTNSWTDRQSDKHSKAKQQ